jgi:purine-nucleoside phosphorylase
METVSDMAAAPNAYARATETVKYVRSQLPEALQYPKVAIVCGSGLGGLAETIESEPKVELAYGTIPNFPQSTGKCRAWKHDLAGDVKLRIAHDAGY